MAKQKVKLKRVTRPVKAETTIAVQACRECGCTNDKGCKDPATGTCFWVEKDLCSMCCSEDKRRSVLGYMRHEKSLRAGHAFMPDDV